MQTEDRTEKQPRLRSASNSKLPLASVIPDTDAMKSSVRLVKEAIKLKAQNSENEDRLDEIKSELHALCAAYDLSGFRHGLCGFEDRGYRSSSCLNKEKLVGRLADYGVPASVIEECYERGAEFLDTRFVAFDLE